ncbi:MAG: lipid-binding SYLF domain-containing protein [Desulfobacterales bacterium]|nr:lipid-binding SYLF domain-containing protein [Desulfobacterales bacterium]
MKTNNRSFFGRGRKSCILASLTLLLFCGFWGSALADSEKKIDFAKIDTEADAALARLHDLKGGKEFTEKAKALLIMPNVGKGALIVGIEHGKGALRIDGKTEDYYSLSAGSVGLQIGGEAKDIIIAFLTTEALEKFRASKNWEAGVDGNIAMISAGDGGTASNITTKEPITAIVFDVKGLFLDLSLKGGKFSKLDK